MWEISKDIPIFFKRSAFKACLGLITFVHIALLHYIYIGFAKNTVENSVTRIVNVKIKIINSLSIFTKLTESRMTTMTVSVFKNLKVP